MTEPTPSTFGGLLPSRLPLMLAAALAACGGAEEAPAGGPPERRTHEIAVRAEPVVEGDLRITSHYTGELFADAVELSPRVSGILETVTVRIGDRVKRGTVLARIDVIGLEHQLEEAKASQQVAQANAARARASREVARIELDRKAPLAKDRLVSAQEISELEASLASFDAEIAAARAQAAQASARVRNLQAQQRDTRIVAPFDAVVASRSLDPGAAVGPTTSILRLVADGPPRVRFRIPERALGTVQAKLPIEIRTAATGERAFQGTVTRLSGEVSRADRSLLIEGRIEESSQLLKPGMYASISVHERTLRDALLVPAQALLSRSIEGVDTPGVFVAVEGAADWRPVGVLGRDRRMAAVSGALSEGEQVLTLGHESLSPGNPIRVVESPRTAVTEVRG